jgi:hypothetical protein
MSKHVYVCMEYRFCVKNKNLPVFAMYLFACPPRINLGRSLPLCAPSSRPFASRCPSEPTAPPAPLSCPAASRPTGGVVEWVGVEWVGVGGVLSKWVGGVEWVVGGRCC